MAPFRVKHVLDMVELRGLAKRLPKPECKSFYDPDVVKRHVPGLEQVLEKAQAFKKHYENGRTETFFVYDTEEGKVYVRGIWEARFMHFHHHMPLIAEKNTCNYEDSHTARLNSAHRGRKRKKVVVLSDAESYYEDAVEFMGRCSRCSSLTEEKTMGVHGDVKYCKDCVLICDLCLESEPLLTNMSDQCGHALCVGCGHGLAKGMQEVGQIPVCPLCHLVVQDRSLLPQLEWSVLKELCGKDEALLMNIDRIMWRQTAAVVGGRPCNCGAVITGDITEDDECPNCGELLLETMERREMVEHDAAFQEGAKAAGVRFVRCPCGHGKRWTT
jgi:hypothetical protein